MDNIYIRNDSAGNTKADKEKFTEKIDGATATIMGLDRAIRCGNDVSALEIMAIRKYHLQARQIYHVRD